MFRKSRNFWKNLICIVNMPSEHVEGSTTGDVTAASFFNVLGNSLQKSY